MWQKNHRSNSPKRRRSNPCRTAGQGERRKASSPWPAVLQGQYMPMRHLVSRVAPTLHDRPATMSFPVLAADAALQEHVGSLPDPPCSQKGVGRDYTDRKSTRLNSSHLGISYAVFCLKKKRDGEAQSAVRHGAGREAGTSPSHRPL